MGANMKILVDNNELLAYKIQDLNIVSNFNTHTKLILNLKLKNPFNMFNKNIEIITDKKIFKGRIILFENMNEEDISIISYSATYELDIKNMFRIYQDADTTYEKIIKDIMGEYKLNYYISKNLNKKINRMYVQYNETDYEFILRILADINEIVYVTYEGIILFGMQNLISSKLENVMYSGNVENEVSRQDIYLIKDKTYITGDILNGKYVSRTEIDFKKNIFFTKIWCSSEYFFKYKYISKVQGLHINARVVEVVSENNIAKMKVDFSNALGKKDESSNKKIIAFTTFYSKTNTGFFPAPEINDNVDVYFPTNNEDDVKIGFCIENEESARFCDYNKRNFTTENISIELDKTKLLFDSNSMILQTKKDLNIVCGQNIKIQVNDELNAYAKKILQVSKFGDIELNSKKNILLKAIKIHNN